MNLGTRENLGCSGRSKSSDNVKLSLSHCAPIMFDFDHFFFSAEVDFIFNDVITGHMKAHIRSL